MAQYILAQDGSSYAAFDQLVSDTHADSSIATLHNVEEGSPVTDHVRPDPSHLTLVMKVTQTPIVPDPDQGRGGPETVELYTPVWKPPFDFTPGAVFREAAGLISGPQPESRTIEVFGFPTTFDRIAETEQKLLDMQSAGTLCQVVTLSRTYTDMVITRVELQRTTLGEGVFSIDLQQIRYVKTAAVVAPVPLEPRGAPKQNKGQQAPKTPQDGAQLQKSDLKALLDGALGALGGS